MLATHLGLTVSPDMDPVATARWVVEFHDALAEDQARSAAARDADGDEPETAEGTGDEAVDALVDRWVKYRPANAAQVRAAIKALRALGYQLVLSDPRVGDTSRTYLRALRPGNGANAGYLNSTSFTFIGTKTLIKGEQGVTEGGRYPYISWDTPGAAETVANVAMEFLRA